MKRDLFVLLSCTGTITLFLETESTLFLLCTIKLRVGCTNDSKVKLLVQTVQQKSSRVSTVLMSTKLQMFGIQMYKMAVKM